MFPVPKIFYLTTALPMHRSCIQHTPSFARRSDDKASEPDQVDTKCSAIASLWPETAATIEVGGDLLLCGLPLSASDPSAGLGRGVGRLPA
jgi:hypothetical protein